MLRILTTKKNQLNPSKCAYTCNETTLLSTECGGELAFNVFLTGLIDAISL